MNYYNEFDPKAAAWLRELIRRGCIAPGHVDDRSIVEVKPADLVGYTQCHFFAGIGIWSYALRLSGWADDRPVWTGSCPCQPFSAAGRGKGFDDERHLWPIWHELIKECQPSVVFGEQVASKAGLEWFDLVHADLEASGYAVGSADLCAASVGAPHIRQRLWFVGMADAGRNERGGWNTLRGAEGEHGCTPGEGEGAGAEGERPVHDPAVRSSGDGVDDPGIEGLEGQRSGHQAEGGWDGAVRSVAEAGEFGGMGNAECKREWRGLGDSAGSEAAAQGRGAQNAGAYEARNASADVRPGPTNGHWRAADWLFCRDGKWRPVEPGTFPLAHGSPARVVRLRGYGNGIVPQAAQAFIETVMDFIEPVEKFTSNRNQGIGTNA